MAVEKRIKPGGKGKERLVEAHKSYWGQKTLPLFTFRNDCQAGKSSLAARVVRAHKTDVQVRCSEKSE